MASGGQQTPLKRIRQNGNQVNHHSSGFGDTQWTLLPNNLELNSRSKPSKKQRNKEKACTTASTEHSPSSQSSPCIGHNSGIPSLSHSFPRTKFTTASWLKDQLGTSGSKKNSMCSDLDETASDTEQPAINRRNIDMPVNQRHQATRNQDAQSVSSRRSVTENESAKAFKEDNTKKAPDTTVIVERLMHLRECIKQVTSIMQNLEKSDDMCALQQMMKMQNVYEDLVEKERMINALITQGAREQMNKLNNLLKQLLQEEQEHLDLLQQVLTPCEESNLAIDGDSSTATASRISTPSKGSHISSKDVNGNEDERMNKQNHLLEKMKESQEKLTALKHQQAALVSLQKKAEDKLAEARAFHAQLIKSNPEIGQSDQECQYASSDRSLHSGGIDECAVNGDTDWDSEVYQDPQPQWQSTNSKKQKNPTQGTVHSSSWQEETQSTSSSIHTNIENLRQRVQILQELSDNRNLVETLSVDDAELVDAGERAAAVEWQRKKLENKLQELHEKKLQMNQLLKELSTLQEESKSGGVSKSCDITDSTFPVPAIRDTQQFLQNIDTEEKRRKLDEMKETLLQLQGMVNNLGSTNDHDTPGLSQGSREESPLNFASASTQRETSVAELSHQPASVKRDNIRKEQSAGFPARRHYEAEGRANEDADVPPVSTGVLPTPDQNSWDSDPRIQEKIRKLQDAKDKLQKIQGLMNSIQQAKQSGQQIPVEYLQLLSSLKDEAEEGDEEDELEDNNDADREDDDSSSINQSNITDISATGIKEICKDTPTSYKRPNDNDGHGDSEENVQQQENELERLMEERTRLLRVHEQLVRLQQNLPGPPRKNNEQIRSSGEGGNLQKKKSHRSDSLISPHDATPPQARKDRSRQDNLLLTRQNVANMESQSRIDNIPNIPAKDIVSAKKDNINNLSANLSKHVLQNSSVRVVPDSLVKDNTDTLSALSAELNHSLSLRDELRRKKAVLEDLLSQDRSKQQDYSRNQDNQSHSGSSVNSEPLEGSSSVLAPDTTVAATWGGSSTQDNFEDEGEEPIESLEEQEEEEEGSNNEGIEHVQPEQGRSVLSQFSTETPFAEFNVNPSAKRRDNRLPQEFKGAQINQWTTRKNFPRVSNSRTHPSLDGPHPENFLSEEETMQQEEAPHVPTGASEANSNSMSLKFAQQLQQQLEQLNTLCQSMLTEQQQIPSNAPRNLPCSYALPNPFTGRPSQPVPDIMHHYTQQLQLQQQLLLSLSQCYHNLYLQQLEIQHLQRCVQQNPDSEASLHHSSPLNPQGPNSEDFAFRPWFLSPWLNTAMPSMPFSQSQISPMSAPPFLQPPPPSFTFSPTSAPSAPPCALAAGSQSSRSVVHPAGQDNRPIPETLNNQVPPRTRANNFWDNFRSYSRQNLLSTSNTAKSNEASGLLAAPQIRQVHPVTSNENSLNQRSRDFVPSHTENGNSTCQGFERVFERPMANSELQELMTKSKKPNLNKHQALTASRSASDISRRTPASLNLSTAVEHSRSNAVQAQNIHSSGPLPTSSPSVNLSRPYHPQLGSKVGEFTFLSSALPSEALRESIYAEVSKLVSQNEFQSDFLVELFQELQNLRSDTLRQRALNAVREMVMREGKGDSKSVANEDRSKNDNQTYNHKPRESTEQLIDIIQDDNAFPTSSSVSDSNNSRTVVENGAMAASTSLGKVQASKPSTGAVKKKTASKVSHAHPPVSNNNHIIQDGTEQLSQSSTSSTIESSQNLVEKVVLDLIPYLQSHIMDECCPNRRSKICARIIDILQANSTTPLSRFFRSQLQQILHRTITKYLGLRLCECEADLLKNITEVLFKELTFHKLMAQAPEESAETSETAREVSPQPEVLSQSVKTVSSGEKRKQSTTGKDSHSELPRIVDSSVDLIDPASQESEGQINEKPTKMLVGENASLPLQFSTLPQHEVTRGAVGGESAFVPHCVTWPVQAGNPEEDMGYECDPEAEIEPEVEAETEADLAEADQSPGQQGTVAVPTPADVRHSDPTQGTSGRGGVIIGLTEDSLVSTEGVIGDAISEVSSTENNLDQEVTLDDITTKLIPLSEEELQRQMTEEQASNSLLQDVIEDIALAGEGDTVRDPVAI